MRIQHNIAALNSYRQLGTNNSAISKNLEKLSSGYKINRAGDDAAGLAISEKMRAQITGLETAQKNANDGISLVQTAEGALTEVHSMLNRMVELATQSSNGTYDNEVDRANLQAEIESLTSEIDRIADSTNFNGINLLDGSLSENPATFEIDLNSIDFEGTVKAGDTFKLEIGGGAAAKAAGGSTESIVLESREAYGDETSAKDIAKLFDGQSVTINGEKYTAKVGDNGILKFTSKTRGELKSTQLPTEGTGIKITSSNKNVTVDAGSTTISNVVNGGPSGTTGTGDVEGGEDTKPTPTPTKTTFKLDITGLTGNSVTSGDTFKITFTNGTLESNAAAGSEANAEDIAALFNGTTLTMNGMDYDVTVASGSTELVFTAKEAGTPESNQAPSSSESVTITIDDKDTSSSTVGGTTSATVTDYVAGTDGTEEVQKTSRAGTDEGVKASFKIDLATVATVNLQTGDKAEITIGSGNKLVSNAAGSAVSSATDLAKMFDKTTFKMGDVEYDVTVSGTELTFTAKEAGKQTSATLPDDNTNVTIAKEASATGNVTNPGGLKTTGKVEGTDPVGDGATTGSPASFDIDLSGLTTINAAQNDTFKLTIDGVDVESNGAGVGGISNDADKLAELFKGKTITIDGTTYDITSNGSKLTFTAQENGKVADLSGKTVSIGKGNTGTGSATGGTLAISNMNVGEDAAPAGGNGDNTEGTTTNKSLTLQIGDTADSFNKITVSIGSMSAESLNIANIDISTPKGAEFAIKNIKDAINVVSSQRGELGAIQNRLEHTINNLGVTTENITSAESRIRDTDMAEEMMAYTKNNILVQASQAMLAQANTLPQGVLQLLQ